MSLNKRLINTSSGGLPPALSPDPSSLSLQSSGSISGGQYGFTNLHLDKINGGRFYYTHVGGEPPNGKIGLANMTGYDLSTVSSGSITSTFAVSYYMTAIGGDAQGTKLFSTGRNDANSNQYISDWTIPSAWSLPTNFSQSGNRPNFEIPMSLDFSNDGTKMFITTLRENSPQKIFEYTLTTAWDVSTKTLISTVNWSDISSENMPNPPAYPNPTPNGFQLIEGRWSFDGSTYYLMLQNRDGGTPKHRLKAYNASTPYSISTLTERNTSTSLDITTYAVFSDMGMSISADGHFLIGLQSSGYGSIELRMFGL